MSNLRTGICGAGIGGLAAAVALKGIGYDARLFEQAPEFYRIGADVNLTPNSVRALDGLGVGEQLRNTAARPTHRISRMWDMGEEISRLEMANTAEEKYGAPQLTTHRADLIESLGAALPENSIQFDKHVVDLTNDANEITLHFKDGTTETVDFLLGADGIHSNVRKCLFGNDAPKFTGLVSYRSVIPQSALSIPNLDAFTKWWGPTPEIQIVTFPLNQGKDTFIFATTPQEDWKHESWTMAGDPDELREVYKDFHEEAYALLVPSQSLMNGIHLSVGNLMKLERQIT